MNLQKLKQKTILKLKENCISSGEATAETEILLNFIFGVTKKDIILTPEKILEADKLESFNSLIDKRIKEKIPVQYLTNKAFFMGEEFYVDKNVLIPRPETEILVEEVLHHCERSEAIQGTNTVKWIASSQAPRNDEIKILDIGTGSGAIACILAKNLKLADIFASDISQKALAIAEFNAEKLGIKDKITFINSDIFKNIDSKEKFDVIISNPPYIPIQEKQNLQPEVVLHEPHLALFAEDEKGISFYEKLAFQAKNRLTENGYLAVEIGIYQSADVVKIFNSAGYKEIKVITDFNKIARVILGK